MWSMHCCKTITDNTKTQIYYGLMVHKVANHWNLLLLMSCFHHFPITFHHLRTEPSILFKDVLLTSLHCSI